MSRAPGGRFLPLVPLLVGVAALEALVRAGVVSTYFLPAPSDVGRALFGAGDVSRHLWRAFVSTAGCAAAGLGASLVVGIAAGIALASSVLVRRVFYPYAVFFQTVPMVAVAPVLVIWLGYGAPTVVASSFIVSVFPVIANALTGILSTDPALRDLFRLYAARRGDTLRKLLLPSALPGILTGARIAAGLAVIGAIVGEFIAGGGLGGVVDEARNQQRLDLVFAAVGLASLLGLAFFGGVGLATRFLLRSWHASEKIT